MRHAAAIWMIMVAVLFSGPVAAYAPERSIAPLPRPGGNVEVGTERAVFDSRSPGIKRSLRPVARPKQRRVVAVQTQTQTETVIEPVRATKRGSVCGVRTIRGEKLKSIRGKLKGCGVSDPVRITAVDGVGLSQASIMDCTTAKALNDWVKKSVKPTVGRLGGGVDSLRVAAHYSCRTRNSKPGAKISEHGKGKAIDISAIKLKNGAQITVLKGWKDPAKGKILKSLHRSACGPFGTVLGPNADRFHRDHFHFDTASYRSGSYCR